MPARDDGHSPQMAPKLIAREFGHREMTGREAMGERHEMGLELPGVNV